MKKNDTEFSEENFKYDPKKHFIFPPEEDPKPEPEKHMIYDDVSMIWVLVE